MLSSSFDLSKPYRYVRYARMSSDQQNPRSPEQQFRTIDDLLQRFKYDWVKVQDYRDDAKSGRYMHKRPQFQQMLEDIRSGRLQVDLILVDTLERFGRMHDVDALRRDLQNKCGVLILTADTNFADPTSPQGRVFGAMEAVRASEDCRVKSHNVRRGKRDAALQGRWPGGPPPFGLQLKTVLSEQRGHRQVPQSVLEHNPDSAWIIRLLFETAHETGWGQVRLARFLNAHADIPERFKPFDPGKVGRWLDHRIYTGELVWDRVTTDVVEDRRICRRNEADRQIHLPDFCPPIVPRELWDAVQALRQVRRQQQAAARTTAKSSDGKQLAAVAPGLTLKHLLTGLVRCGHCGRAMRPCSGGKYVSIGGDERTYLAYMCPGYITRICENSRSVPEAWLREAVVAKIRERLFPPYTASAVWLTSLLDEVREELRRLRSQHLDRRPALHQAVMGLQSSIKGWTMTLGQPALPTAVRRAIERQMEDALAQAQEQEVELAMLDSQEAIVEQLVDERVVLDRLGQLHDILATQNPTMGNLELSLHIDRIDSFADGRVVMRTCRLGALTGVPDVLAPAGLSLSGESCEPAANHIRPRRRGRLRVDVPLTEAHGWQAIVDFATDPDRFAGLDKRWFWEDVFMIPRRKSWAEEIAPEVAARRRAGLTEAKIAEEFDTTIPTIRVALRHAVLSDESLRQLPRKMPRARWHEEYAVEVASLKRTAKLNTLQLADHFGKSDTTIRKAIEHAARLSTDSEASAEDRVLA